MSEPTEIFVSTRLYSRLLAPAVLVFSIWAVARGGGFVYLVVMASAIMLGTLAPWRVAIRSDGLVLSFPLRRAIVLPKAETTVWVMRGRRAIAFRGERPRPGRYYQLPVSVQRTNVVEVLSDNGFRVITELMRP